MQKRLSLSPQQVGRGIFFGLLAYMPFHIFISTVVGANIGGLNVLKALKDVVLMFGFCMVLLSSVSKPWFRSWLTHTLTLTIGVYGLLTILLAIIRPTDSSAEILGVTYNLRFLIFFLYGWLLAMSYPKRQLFRTALRIVLSSATIVAIFGIVQYLFLPNDALTHLGFTRSNGVLPAFFIDDKPDLERVMSTLRDPNSLGSYLIITICLAAAAWSQRAKASRQLLAGIGLASLLCLILTFSRSALLGLIVALGIGVVLVGKDRIHVSRRQLQRGGFGLAAAIIIGLSGLYVLRNSYVVQNVLFHADQSTTLEDPNQLRIRFLKESVTRIVHAPLGLGPGRAGLASIKNKIQGTQLNENYYLQIATEVGVAGLLLFVAILWQTARKLYRANPRDMYTIALLASLGGLCVTNMLVHIWSNEAVAYTWWGLAGLAIVGRNDNDQLSKKSS